MSILAAFVRGCCRCESSCRNLIATLVHLRLIDWYTLNSTISTLLACEVRHLQLKYISTILASLENLPQCTTCLNKAVFPFSS